jgi:hypothetical protein
VISTSHDLLNLQATMPSTISSFILLMLCQLKSVCIIIFVLFLFLTFCFVFSLFVRVFFCFVFVLIFIQDIDWEPNSIDVIYNFKLEIFNVCMFITISFMIWYISYVICYMTYKCSNHWCEKVTIYVFHIYYTPESQCV